VPPSTAARRPSLAAEDQVRSVFANTEAEERPRALWGGGAAGLFGTPDLTYFVPLAVGVLLLSFGTDYNLARGRLIRLLATFAVMTTSWASSTH
jgi:hypothetical protein